MDKSLKKIIVSIATLAIFAFMYLGSYLPLVKSQLYVKILILLETNKIQSVKDFLDLINPALEFYSPVGQDEVVSYYTGGILASVISQQNNPQVVEGLVKDAEKWMEPIIKFQKGFSVSQNLFNFAQIYLIAATKLQSVAFLEKSIDLFKEGLKNSPNRYIFLGGLFNAYQIQGNKEGMKEIGSTILKYWPDKEEIRKAISSL
jgi:tetratricopeptide (TPR) repeat protein